MLACVPRGSSPQFVYESRTQKTGLKVIFKETGSQLWLKLRVGAEKETKRRWDDEWFPVAGKLLGLSGTTLESDPRPEEEVKESKYSFQKSEAPTTAVPNDQARSDAERVQRAAPRVEDRQSQQERPRVEENRVRDQGPLLGPEPLPSVPAPVVSEAGQNTHVPAVSDVNHDTNRTSIISENSHTPSIAGSEQTLEAPAVSDVVPEAHHGGTFLSYAPMRPEST